MWHEKLEKYHLKDLGMCPLHSGPSLYFLMSKGLLIRPLGGYVEDLIRAGDAEFLKMSHKANENLEMAEDNEPP